MKGKMGGDAAVKQVDISPALKKEIAELETRKNNLQLEINRAVITATQKLEADYDKKSHDLAITYQSRLSKLESDKDSIEKQRKELAEKDVRIIKTVDELRQERIKIDREREDITAAQKQSIVSANNQTNYIDGEKNKLLERERTLKSSEDLISKREDAVEVIEIAFEEREKAVRSAEEELLKKAEELTALKEKLGTVEDGLGERQNEVNAAQLEVDALKQKLSEACKRAAEDQELAATALSGIKDIVAKNEALSKNLSELRETLSEKETTLKEKEKALLIQAKDIDGKISILNKLRSEVK